MSYLPENSFFQDLCLHAGVALIATDEQFRIRFWNPCASRIFGSSSPEMFGQPVTRIMSSERRDMTAQLCERALTKGEISEFEFWHDNPAGQSIYLAITISPIIDENGRSTGVSLCVRDVTRGVELVRDVAKAQRMSALGMMAGAVAHHFNNLLGGIITSIDFAEHSGDPEAIRRTLKNIQTGLTRANKLTLNLLAFAEGDRTGSPLKDITEAVKDFVANLQPKLTAQNIVLETDLESVDTPVPAKLLLTVLDSIADNACEAMPDGGILRVEMSLGPPDNSTVLLRLADTGTGIQEKDLPHVFEPFFTTKRGDEFEASGHVGLGLAVVHGIVKDLGGTVTLSPGLTGGTVCLVRLPSKIKNS